MPNLSNKEKYIQSLETSLQTIQSTIKEINAVNEFKQAYNNLKDAEKSLKNAISRKDTDDDIRTLKGQVSNYEVEANAKMIYAIGALDGNPVKTLKKQVDESDKILDKNPTYFTTPKPTPSSVSNDSKHSSTFAMASRLNSENPGKTLQPTPTPSRTPTPSPASTSTSTPSPASTPKTEPVPESEHPTRKHSS
jgi:hypothetical protein